MPMIILNCTHCRAALEMDEAFAGGVCRCQHCGTIQTVPKNLRPGENGEGQAVSGRSTTKTQFQMGRHGGTGLDELGDVVTSSGLSRSAIRGGSGLLGDMTPSTVVPQDSGSVSYATPRQQKKSNKTVLMIVLGAVAAVVIVCVLYLFLGSSSKTTVGPAVRVKGATVVNENTPDAPVPTTPNFLGVDLTKASSVVYVIDRGSSMNLILDRVKASTARSVETLGSGKKFAVLFWSLTDEPAVVSYPETGLADANDQTAADMIKKLEDVVEGGQTKPITALQHAAQLNPTDVVLITAKADDLDEEIVATVEQTFKGKARVHTIALRSDDGNVMKQIKDKTGGGYKLVMENELTRFTKTH